MNRNKCGFDILGKIEKKKKKRNWSEYTLAQNSNLTQSTISTWYRKQLQPSVASLEKICNGFGITLAQFFSEEDLLQSLTVEQKELLELWQSLSPIQKSAVIQLLKSFI